MSISTPPVGIADIGVTGLGVMGSNLARNLARNGFKVAVHNRSEAAPRTRWKPRQRGRVLPGPRRWKTCGQPLQAARGDHYGQGRRRHRCGD